MKKLVFIMAILLFQIAVVEAQQNNTRQRMSFKSIVIQNGDTIVTEKNFDSDDPNANLNDSIPFGNGSFQFSFGDINPDNFFGNRDPFALNPFFNDSLLSLFFNNPFIKDTTINRSWNSIDSPESSDNLVPYVNKESNYNMSDFKVAIIAESNIMNITFKQSPTEISEISITNNSGKGIYTEQFEKSDGYYVRQIELDKLGKGKFTILLKQGSKVQTQMVTIQ